MYSPSDNPTDDTLSTVSLRQGFLICPVPRVDPTLSVPVGQECFLSLPGGGERRPGPDGRTSSPWGFAPDLCSLTLSLHHFVSRSLDPCHRSRCLSKWLDTLRSFGNTQRHGHTNIWRREGSTLVLNKPFLTTGTPPSDGSPPFVHLLKQRISRSIPNRQVPRP